MNSAPSFATETSCGNDSSACSGAPPSPSKPGRARARDARDEAVRRDLPHDVVQAVGEVHRAVGRGRDALRLADLRFGRRPAVSRSIPAPPLPARVVIWPSDADPADAVVQTVGDVEDALRVDGHVVRLVERRVRSLAAVAERRRPASRRPRRWRCGRRA